MGQRKVSQEERELIFLRKQAGQTLQEIAEDLVHNQGTLLDTTK